MARRKKTDTAKLITNPSRALAFLIGFPEARVLDVDEDRDGLHISAETSDDEARCPSCGMPAVLEGRTVAVWHPPGPAFGRPAELFWQLRRWRCPAPDCAAAPWTEEIPARSVGGDRPEQ